MGAISTLEAVNTLLRAASERPVNSLLDAVGDTEVAQDVLEEVNKRVQMTGLFFNVVESTEYPDINGNIPLSSNTLFVESTGESRTRKLVSKGTGANTLLYDLDDGTDVFAAGEPVYIRTTIRWDFEEVPTNVQQQIVSEAARIYQMRVQGDTEIDQFNAQIEARSRIAGRRANARTHRANILNKSSADQIYNRNKESF